MEKNYDYKHINTNRKSGIIMHISSLWSDYGIGSLGKEAYEFADFLSKTGTQLWQILPIGPTGYGDSPYQSFSSFAGNPYFIDFITLEKEGLLKREDFDSLDYGNDQNRVDYGKIYNTRNIVLKKAFANFKANDEYNKFILENSDWIEDYSLFMALKENFGNVSYLDFPTEVRNRDEEVLNRYREELKENIDYHKFLQFEFFKQYLAWKDYVNSLGIKVVGDMPIYVSPDSLEVWKNPELFLDDIVGGCPPDGFSAGGQKWGNPIYDWEKHEKQNFEWWINRIKKTLKYVDVLRIDHFRGFESYWAVPRYDEDARNGKWVLAPGAKLFDKVKEVLGDIEIVAEDLGYTTKEVVEFREHTGFPGMKMLQFAFNPDYESDFIPHQIERNWAVYTGTHDSDTVKSWFEKANKKEVEFAKKYLNLTDPKDYVKGFIRAAWSSVANIAVAQIQDFLELGDDGRMNIPATSNGNWSWRVNKEMLTDKLANEIYDMNKTYFRLNKKG
ncbi:4-alpha-glucanotransferase [Pseudostreptobacillus hongkongensis]|uniref:4-alpha-glucanotransferase n=1 Tax=Pseudostreptobacillus hongkongensis TaxID=1162717 RepID=UPI0028D23766|nr:4-alpha-glucanotransferase [Pseudostreptobacillus hongkongensis]